jgi:uncharacterized protein
MQHLTLKATTTVTDAELGQFEAIVSAWEADRENDTIAVTAFDETIRAWRASCKRVPLLFEHGTETVGHIDPESMHATQAGLVASGEIDRDTDRGKQAWRMVKSGVAGFSIGFMSDSRERADGGRELTSIDLLEISVTSTPTHPATRALSWKGAGRTADLDVVPTDAEIRERMQRSEVAELASKSAKPGPVHVESFEC